MSHFSNSQQRNSRASADQSRYEGASSSTAGVNEDEQGEYFFDQNSRHLAQFLAAKERLRDRMALASAELHSLRSLIDETKREFDIRLQQVHKHKGASYPESKKKEIKDNLNSPIAEQNTMQK